MTKDQLQLMYLELCEALEREATDAGFEKFRKDPQLQKAMKDLIKDIDPMLAVRCENHSF